MIRIAAVGDVHYDRQRKERFYSQFKLLSEKADLFVIAGDLTQSGALEEAQALAEDLRGASIPVIAVLGNHDYHRDQEKEIAQALQKVGVTVLDGNCARFEIRGKTVGIVGIKGFGGGFAGACVTEFGEPETKAFAHFSKEQADRLRQGFLSLKTDYKFALLHYSPIETTLFGEKKEIYPFLGSYLLAEVIDEFKADGVFHGHAHLGTERGSTPGGVPVRNVALTVIRHVYNVYSFEEPSQSVLPSIEAWQTTITP